MERVGLDAVALSEAAAWLARLRSDERTAADEAGLRAWLDEGEPTGERSTSSTRPGRPPAVSGLSGLSYLQSVGAPSS